MLFHHSLPIKLIRLSDYFPPPTETVCFWKNIYTLCDSFIAFTPHYCIHLFLFSIHLWPTHSFGSKGACLFSFARSVCRCYGSIFLEGWALQRLETLKLLFSFQWFVLVLQHVSMCIKAGKLIKKQLTSSYRLLQCPNCWRLHFVLYDKSPVNNVLWCCAESWHEIIMTKYFITSKMSKPKH